MKFLLNKAAKWISTHEIHILSTGIVLTTLILSAACFWKYSIFAYNGFDLAYFNQVFWNSLQGRFFSQSIHPHLSLGDHAELLIPLLLPFYAIVRDPRSLLILQAAVLAIAAAPLYLLAKRRLGNRSRAPLLLALAYLASPLVHNIAFDEFHILPFAVPFLFAAALAYDRGRKIEFVFWAIAAMLCREDVPLVIGAFGLLAWVEKRSRFWRFAPLVIGAAWFFAAMRLVSHYAPEGGYKFMVYYSWLGSSFGDMFVNALRHPLAVIAHVTTFPNLWMLVGFGMPMLFIPYLRPRRLILAIGPLAQIMLGAPGGGAIIIETHYASLFLPALFIAAIDGVGVAAVIGRKLHLHKEILGTIFTVSAIYSAVILGPWLAIAGRMLSPDKDRLIAAAAHEAIAHIPAKASVAASYRLLPQLSSRDHLTSLHYVFLGVTQFGAAAYQPPADRIVAFDSEDLLTYRAQFLKTAWTRPHYDGGYGRLQRMIGAPIFSRDAFTVFDRDLPAKFENVPDRKPASASLYGGRIILETWTDVTPYSLDLTMRWSSSAPPEIEPAMRLTLKNEKNETVLARDYGFANAPISIRDLADGPAVSHLSLPIAMIPAGRYAAEIELAEEDAILTLSDTIVRNVTRRESWGSATFFQFTRR